MQDVRKVVTHATNNLMAVSNWVSMRVRCKRRTYLSWKSSDAKHAEMKSEGMWKVKMSDSGKTVWWELLCSEETESAALMHALLIWDRGWQVPFSARTSPCSGHTLPWPERYASVLTHPRLWAARLFSVVSCLPKRRQQTRSRARGPTRWKKKWLRGTVWGFQCLLGGKHRSPLL